MLDVAVVGSGHNGLICAAYLAQAGLKVGVFERQDRVGGAVQTRGDLLPGYQIDVGSSAHVMIHQTPLLRELELEKFGLEYLEMDPWAFAPVPGHPGKAIKFYRSVERTCASIAEISPRDARAYREFCEAWGELNEGVFAAFLKAPTPLNLASSMFGRSLKGRNRMHMLRLLMAPYGQLVCETFEHEALRTAILWLAAQSGPPPFEGASGDFAGWHPMYHRSGMKRPRGGSGELTQALQRRLLADGAEVRVNAEVDAILCDAAGRTTGLRLAGGETVGARAVVAAGHVHTTFGRLLRDVPQAAPHRAAVAHTRVGNGFGMIVRCAMRGLPPYPGEALDAAGVGECHRGLQLLCPSRAALDSAYGEFLQGRPPARPLPLAMTFSALDATLAPPGKHVMFVWGQYHPYELANGEDWDAIAEREADKLVRAVDDWAPGTRGLVDAWHVQTPKEIERRHGLLRANVMHLEMSFDQMFAFRPTPELAGYAVPGLPGLYLTGASTHPGGGVWGASGHNTARLMLRHRRRWR